MGVRSLIRCKEVPQSIPHGPGRRITSDFVGEPGRGFFGALHAKLVLASARVVNSNSPLLSHVRLVDSPALDLFSSHWMAFRAWFNKFNTPSSIHFPTAISVLGSELVELSFF